MDLKLKYNLIHNWIYEQWLIILPDNLYLCIPMKLTFNQSVVYLS